MVCQRCIQAVENHLNELGIAFDSIELGKVVLSKEISDKQKKELSELLENDGFELLTNKSSQLIESIKNIVIEIVHYDKEILPLNFSDYISKELNKDYNSLSRLFSSVEGITIEKFIIQQKVERVKELLIYDELSLSEISYKLHYSSLQYMSNQFKKVTGLSPRAFKKLNYRERKPLDEL